MPRPLPEFVRFLNEELKCALLLRGDAFDFEYFIMDLSGWKLRFSDRTPVVWIEARRLEATPTDELVAAVQAMLHNQYYTQRLPILLLEGRSPPLRDALRLRLPYCALLDEDDVRQAMAKPVSERRLLETLCSQLPLASLSPYEISSPVAGSRFFGREYELRTILGHHETNYALVGVRRIGKSSLLLELKRRFEAMGHQAVYFFDCTDFGSAEDYIRAVATEVDVRERQRMSLQQFPNFLRVKSHKGRSPLVFLLDEVERLIEVDRPARMALFDVLRASAIKGFCRYIMTGYRLLIDETLNANSPLFNFVTRQPLGNLTRDDTERLIVVPMENLGVSFERRSELLGQIYRQTAGHPNYVQFYCHSLVQLMDRENRRRIGPQDLAVVHTDPEFERYVFRTFTANTNDLEKAVVYAMVLDGEEAFTTRDVDVALKKRRAFATSVQIDQACDKLLTACVLDKQGQSFSFAIPILNQLLKDHYDLDYLFGKAREDGKLAAR